jgi:hypothetical protein
MRKKKTKAKKTRAASYKAVVASVTKEMARPRVAESAQAATDAQSQKRRGKAARAAKAHIERYGTGTPTAEGTS